LSAARAARAGADPDRALEIYQRLAERGGPLAENALYEIGGIYRDQLRQPRQALVTWERYRARYPRGLLRAEADLSIVDTLSSMGESTRALKEALAFLRNHPRNERRGEIARVAGDLYRSRGHCRDAAELYGRVDGTSASKADADDAAYGRAACLEMLGDPGAVSALREYLRVRPAGRHSGEAARLLGGR
jgi:tetratricopeptide (TPR) repeat protein